MNCVTRNPDAGRAVGRPVTAHRWRLLTFAVAAATGALLAGLPLTVTSTCTTTELGPLSCSSRHESLVTTEGSSVLVVLALPALLALVPVVLASRRATAVTAGALTVLAVLGAASIGVFLVPTVVAAWLAVGAARREAAVAGT